VKHDRRAPKSPAGPARRFRPTRPRTAFLLAAAALATLALAAVGSAAPSAACSFCGKNLIRNPGAESGSGQNAPGESGAVPGWTNTAGQFGAASYTSFGGGWFTATSTGPADRGKNYFFGGTTTAATSGHATVGTQTIKAPAGAAGHKATLSGWLGNYGADTAQVRAEFMDSSGKVISTLRIGPDTTIGGGNMSLRTRSSTVPTGTSSIAIVVTFTDHNNYNLAGADDLSLVLD
jgi:hypothetical protein